MIFEIERAWKDGCNHPQDTYVGSFECVGDKYDLYVYSGDFEGQHVCIRYGDDPSQYYSPGSLRMFIQGTHKGMPMYDDALEMLLAKGTFSWGRKG